MAPKKRLISELIELEVMRRISHGVATMRELEVVMKNFSLNPVQIETAVKALIRSGKIQLLPGQKPRKLEVINHDFLSSELKRIGNSEEALSNEIKALHERILNPVRKATSSQGEEAVVIPEEVEPKEIKIVDVLTSEKNNHNGNSKTAEVMLKLNTGEEIKISAKNVRITIHNDDINITSSGE